MIKHKRHKPGLNSIKHFPTRWKTRFSSIYPSSRFNTARDEPAACGTKNWDEAMRHDEKDITFQSTFGNASWSISASLDWVRPRYQQDTWRQVPVCLLAYVSALKSQEDLPYRASGRLPNVNVAICSIYKLPRCPRTGAPCVLYISKQLFMSIGRTIADPWMTFHSHSYQFCEFMMGCVWGLNADLMQQHVWKLFSLWLESRFSACKSLKWPQGQTGRGRKDLGRTEKVGLWASRRTFWFPPGCRLLFPKQCASHCQPLPLPGSSVQLQLVLFFPPLSLPDFPSFIHCRFHTSFVLPI